MRQILWRVLLPLAAVVNAGAASLPERWVNYVRTSSTVPAIADKALFNEFGFEQAETARYEDGAKKAFGVTLYRFRDSTGAYAAFLELKPAEAKPVDLPRVAVAAGSATWLAFGNYLAKFDGLRPTPGEWEALLGRLPRMENTALPGVTGFLPVSGRMAGSERYILGPVSLAKYAPGVEPSKAAFHMGAEGTVAQYRDGAAIVPLVIFEYPTPQIARERVGQIPGVAKRSGPLVAVVQGPAEANYAERLLAQVRYDAVVTTNEKIPKKQKNAGAVLLEAVAMAGYLIVGSIMMGLVVAGILMLARRRRPEGESDGVTALHLNT